MSFADDSHAIDRYVAGLPVDGRELVPAIAELALDRTLVTQALLNALTHPQAVVRMRAARAAADMEGLGAVATAALRALARDDVDGRVRAAAAGAVRASLEVTAPSEPPGRVARALASLRLGPGGLALRSAEPEGFALRALDRAPGSASVDGNVVVDDEGLVCLVLTGLPQAFRGTHPVVRVSLNVGAGTREIARARSAVAADGSVTIQVPAAAGLVGDVLANLRAGIELVVEEG